MFTGADHLLRIGKQLIFLRSWPGSNLFPLLLEITVMNGIPQVTEIQGKVITNVIEVGKGETCGNSWCSIYCEILLARIRMSYEIPIPCRMCGNGVQSKIYLCQAYGHNEIRFRHIAIEWATRQEFSLVLSQLFTTRISD